VKIAVCVKHVPDGRLRLDPDTKRIDRSGDGALNRVDVNAIEEALKIKDRTECEVVLVSVGPQAAVESLLTGLALGADRAVLVSDSEAAGSDLVATSKLLAAVLEREDPDLALFGQQSLDGSGGLLWAAVAERLAKPVISQAASLVLSGPSVAVTRQSEAGNEVIEAPLPAVIGVSDSINEPRYSSLRGKMGAKKKPFEVVKLADLGVDPDEVGEKGSRTRVLTISAPPPRGSTTRIEEQSGAARAILEFLTERELV
jgi:electron transfer flavoprotein beta subunit